MTNPVAVRRVTEGGVATLTLCRPPRNAMTAELCAGFLGHLADIRRDPSVRAVVIAGEGRHFCTGADLSGDHTPPGHVDVLGGAMGTAERLRALYTPFMEVLELDVPTVAAVRGAAVGGGLGLAAACDFRVVAPETRFMAPFVRLGIHPGMALTRLLPALVGLPRSLEMLLLGREVRGEEALAIGLATRCVSEDQVDAGAHELAPRLAAGAPGVARWTRRAVHRAIAFDPRTAADTEALAQALTFSSEDAAEGLRAFFEKREPRFEGR